jgi:thymidylate synthase
MPVYRNISAATVFSVRDVLAGNKKVVVREKETTELRARVTRIERPYERYVFLPSRGHSVFAQCAETMWVLAGRDDITWLGDYLPRAPSFSDDGTTWRGAYGPRLRSWSGVDQVDAVRKLLQADRTTRQAVMMLFDPAKDFEPSKDIPCNNWLSWLVREDQLHLSVALRSNDIWWGLSGINAFEWSVLQEIMAFWIGVEIGHLEFYAASFHLYAEHYDPASDVIEGYHGLSPYDFGITRTSFATPWEDFATRLERWFALEAAIRGEPERPLGGHGSTGDPLFDSFLNIVHLRWAHERWGEQGVRAQLAGLPACDYVAALYERLGRTYPGLLQKIAQPEIAAYFAAADQRKADPVTEFITAVKQLHRDKDRAYGGAWKRRGELVSILPNIARKVDRLDTLVVTASQMTGETALDTAIDLLVYAEKYCLFLAEKLEPGTLLAPDAPTPLSDHEANFDVLLDRCSLAPGDRDVPAVVKDIVAAFDAVWKASEAGASAPARLDLARILMGHAAELLALLVHNDRPAVTLFLQAGSS